MFHYREINHKIYNITKRASKIPDQDLYNKVDLMFTQYALHMRRVKRSLKDMNFSFVLSNYLRNEEHHLYINEVIRHYFSEVNSEFEQLLNNRTVLRKLYVVLAFDSSAFILTPFDIAENALVKVIEENFEMEIDTVLQSGTVDLPILNQTFRTRRPRRERIREVIVADNVKYNVRQDIDNTIKQNTAISGLLPVTNIKKEIAINPYHERQQRRQNVLITSQKHTQDLREEANQKRHTDELFLERQKKYAMTIARKHHNREAYKKRISEKTKPTLNDLSENMRYSHRMFLRFKRHDCHCGLKENRIIQKDSTIEFSCNHKESKKLGVEIHKCSRCGYLGQLTKKESPCGCKFYICTYCKVSDFEGKEKMYFDKHVIPGYCVKIGEKSDTLEKDVKKEEHFLKNINKMQLPEPHSKFEVLGKLPTVRTKRQGGTVSMVTSGINSGAETIKLKLKDLAHTIIMEIKSIRSKFHQIGKFMDIVDKIDNFLTTFHYLAEFVIGVLVEMNPLVILELVKAISQKDLLAIGLSLGSLMFDLIKVEEVSLLKIRTALETGVIEGKNFGIWTPYIVSEVNKIKKKSAAERRKRARELLQEIASKGSIFKSEIWRDELVGKVQGIFPVQESGFDIVTMFCDLCDKFPSPFQAGMKVFKFLLIDLKPYLLGIKALNDTKNIVVKVVETITTYITGEIKEPKAWLQAKIHTPGNPIHDLVALFVAYDASTADPEYKTDANELRSQFYSKLAECTEYVKDQKHMSGTWLTFRKGLTTAMDTPPKARPRKFEPTVIVLSGGSGKGKSTMWKAMIAQELLTPAELESDEVLEKIESLTYTWNVASDYQVGMSNSKVILFDDFMQDRENSTEAASLIQLCTTAPFPINSPSITGPEIKGMCASPEMIIICTNVTAELAAQGLAEPNALKRRYNIEFELADKFDPEKLDEPNLTIRSCSRYGSLIGKQVSFNEARALVSTIHRASRENFASIQKKVSDIAKDKLKDIVRIPPPVSTLKSKPNMWQQDNDLKRDYNLFVRDVATVRESSGKEILTIISNTLATGIVVGMPVILTYSFISSIGVVADIIGSVYVGGTPRRQIIKQVITHSISTILTTVSVVASLYYLLKQHKVESGSTRTAKAKHVQSTVYDSVRESSDSLDEVFRMATGSIANKSNGSTVNCLFIGGHFILVPRHALYTFPSLKEGQKFFIMKSNWEGEPREFAFEKRRVIEIVGNIHAQYSDSNFREDLVIYKLDKRFFKAEKQIIQHFWDGSFPIEKFPVTKIDYISWDDKGFVGEFRHSRGIVETELVRTNRHEGGTVVHHYVGLSNCESRSSSCGSIYRIDRQSAPIVGVHIATLTRTNQSCIHYITRKSIEQSLKGHELIDVEIPFEPNSQRENGHILPYNCLLEKEGNTTLSVYRPTTTDLRPSLVHHFDGPATTAPSVLHGYDERLKDEFRGKEFYKQLFKDYQRGDKFFTKEDLHLAYKSLLKESTAMIKEHPWPKKKDRTLHEEMEDCLNGYHYIEGNTKMDMSTSPGYPYVSENLTKKKLFKVIDDVIIPEERIVTDYFYASEKIKNGVVPFLPFSLTLKDERVKLKKIETPKTRIFGCANVIHYMIMRKYFHRYLMALYHNPVHKSFCIPSLDRLSAQWNDMTNHMLSVGDMGFDFDFQFWDRTMQKIMLHYATNIMLADSDVTLKERMVLSELNSAPHMIWGNTVYRSSGILMSGSLVTFTINCLINEMIHRAAFFHLTADFDHPTSPLSSYHSLTKGMRAGDDTITTVSPLIEEEYNGETVAQYLRERGMRVTDGSKNEEIQPLKPYMDLIFLKNYTQYKYSLYLPKPTLEDLKESMRWVRANAEMRAALSKGNRTILIDTTSDNVTAALRGVFFHGKEVYDNIYDKLTAENNNILIPMFEELEWIWVRKNCFPGAHPDFSSHKTLASMMRARGN